MTVLVDGGGKQGDGDARVFATTMVVVCWNRSTTDASTHRPLCCNPDGHEMRDDKMTAAPVLPGRRRR